MPSNLMRSLGSMRWLIYEHARECNPQDRLVFPHSPAGKSKQSGNILVLQYLYNQNISQRLKQLRTSEINFKCGTLILKYLHNPHSDRALKGPDFYEKYHMEIIDEFNRVRHKNIFNMPTKPLW